LTTRRTLTPAEEAEAASMLADLSQRQLDKAQRDLFRSLESYFTWDKRLSSKQLDALVRLHRTATRGVYGRALSDSDRLNGKLNAVFTSMKNGGKD
jgi:hypothetical protein